MAARNKPAGIRSLVYGIGKSKAGIEGLRHVEWSTNKGPKNHAPGKPRCRLTGPWLGTELPRFGGLYLGIHKSRGKAQQSGLDQKIDIS